MRKPREPGQWHGDIASRPRSVVFPDTARNEAQFWRNLGALEYLGCDRSVPACPSRLRLPGGVPQGKRSGGRPVETGAGDGAAYWSNLRRDRLGDSTEPASSRAGAPL
jgi:hypothetical protein